VPFPWALSAGLRMLLAVGSGAYAVMCVKSHLLSQESTPTRLLLHNPLLGTIFFSLFINLFNSLAGHYSFYPLSSPSYPCLKINALLVSTTNSEVVTDMWQSYKMQPSTVWLSRGRKRRTNTSTMTNRRRRRPTSPSQAAQAQATGEVGRLSSCFFFSRFYDFAFILCFSLSHSQ
jgi:hypothetical protein